MSDNRDILNEAFFGSKKSKMASALKDIQYAPVDKKQVGQPGYGSILSPDKGFFAVSDPDEAKKRLVGSFGAIVGNNTIKTMASKAIKTFPIIVSDNVEPETAVMLKKVMEEQYAQYIELYISNTMINANDFATGNKDGNVAIQALSSIDSDDFSKRQGFATKTKGGDFGTAADILTKNSMLQNLLRQESFELKAGDEFTDTLMEDAIVIPKEVDEMFLDYMNENMDSIMESINGTLSANGKKRLMSGECRMDALSKKVEEACQKRGDLKRGKSVQENLNTEACLNELAELAAEFRSNVNTSVSLMEDFMPFVNASDTLIESAFPFFKELHNAKTLNEAITSVNTIRFEYDNTHEVSKYLKVINSNMNQDVANALQEYALEIRNNCMGVGEKFLTHFKSFANYFGDFNKMSYDKRQAICNSPEFKTAMFDVNFACIRGLKVLGDFAYLASNNLGKTYEEMLSNDHKSGINDSYNAMLYYTINFLNAVYMFDMANTYTGLKTTYFYEMITKFKVARADPDFIDSLAGTPSTLKQYSSKTFDGPPKKWLFFPSNARKRVLDNFAAQTPLNIDDINEAAYRVFKTDRMDSFMVNDNTVRKLEPAYDGTFDVSGIGRSNFNNRTNISANSTDFVKDAEDANSPYTGVSTKPVKMPVNPTLPSTPPNRPDDKKSDDDEAVAIPVYGIVMDPVPEAGGRRTTTTPAEKVEEAKPVVKADADAGVDPRAVDPDFDYNGLFAGLGYIVFAFDRSVYTSLKNNRIIEAISSENQKLQNAYDALMKTITDANSAAAAATAASRAENNEQLAEKQATVENCYQTAMTLFQNIKIHLNNIQGIKDEFDRVKNMDAEAINLSRNIADKVRKAGYDMGVKIQREKAAGRDTSELEYHYQKLQYRYRVAEAETAEGKFAQKFYSDNTADIIRYTTDSTRLTNNAELKVKELRSISKSASKLEFAPTQNLKDYMQNLAKNDRSNNAISFLSKTDISDLGSRTMSTGNLDSTEIVVNKNLMDKVVERRVMDILNSDKELRAWYEEATFLLQARKISAREYISYVTERLGLPMSDSARKELTLRFKDVKFADIRQNFGLITDGDVEAAAENGPAVRAAMAPVTRTKVGTALKGLTIGGGAAAAVGVGLLASPFMLTLGLPIVAIGGVVGGVSALILAIKKKIAKQKRYNLEKVPRGDWRIVEKMINIIEQQRKDVKAAYKEASGANIGSKDLADFVNRANIVDPQALNKAIANAQKSMALTEDDEVLDGVLEGQTWHESKLTIQHLAAEAQYLVAECIEEEAELKNEIMLNEAVISTTTPIKLVQKYSYDTHSKPEIMVTPEYSARANKAYGSVEYDKRDLKDRRYNSPLMLKINFKQRFADGTYSDNEMTAVVGILGVITRVPSEEMKEILRSNIQDVTLHGVLAPEGGKDNKASIMNIFAAGKKNPKLEVSSELWNNLEKMSKMAFVNRLAGRQNDNIANAHLIFSQKEIDDVKSESNVDYLRDKKVVAKLMKRYNAFTIVVTNDIAERLYIFDDLDNINWNVVPYSALRSKDSSTDTMVSAIQKLRNL